MQFPSVDILDTLVAEHEARLDRVDEKEKKKTRLRRVSHSRMRRDAKPRNVRQTVIVEDF